MTSKARISTTDVLVLGSGAAGLAAALTSAAGGAKVIVLEASNLYGGTTAVSSGGIWLPGNGLDPNWEDSLEGAKAYLQRLTLGLTPEAIIDRYLEVASIIADFLVNYSPLTFSPERGRPDYHAPWPGSSQTGRTVHPGPYNLHRLGEFASQVRRPGPAGTPPIQHSELNEMGVPPDMLSGDTAPSEQLETVRRLIKERTEKGIALRGLALVGGLMEGCTNRGVEFMRGTRGRSLIVENGRVVGLRAERDRIEVEYRARSGIVLATGGFEWNRDLWDAFLSRPYDGPATPPVSHGDGLIMAAAVGAKLADLDKATWVPSISVGEMYDGHPYVRTGGFSHGQRPGEILVNRSGRRFVNEALNYNDIGYVYTYFDPGRYEFVNHPAFLIGDNQCLRRLELAINTRRPNDGDGWFIGNTLSELARKLGIDEYGLGRQIKEWNEHASNGTDPVFHRGEKPWETYRLPGNRSIGPIVEGPYVGHRVRASVFGTRGGPVINEHAQIMDFYGHPIAGLYGAGSVVAHPFRSAFPGGGANLGPCVVFGYIAGRSLLLQH